MSILSECCAELFPANMSSGTRLMLGGHEVRIDGVVVYPDAEAYVATWNTKHLGLNQDEVYRIWVLVGSVELGFVDAQVVETISQLRKVDRSRYYPLLHNSILPIPFWIGEAAIDIAVTEVSAPSRVARGDVVNISVMVKNAGHQDVTGDITVELADVTEPAPDLFKDAIITGGLAAGSSTTVTFSWNTVSSSLTDHTLQARLNLVDDDASNNVNSTVATVELAVTVDFTRATGVADRDRIIRPDGSFIADGFVAGDVIELTVPGAPVNNGMYMIESVTASAITLTASGSLKANRVTTSLVFDHIIHTCTGAGCTPPAPTNEIRRSDGKSWTTETLFVVGSSITVAGAGSNNGTFTITSISGSTLGTTTTVVDQIVTSTVFIPPYTTLMARRSS